ncbi:glycoside hydrolase family 65 [Halalkalibacter urbisdiaboli]|uniref:glycoside hydrolase family 65 n=1 Tax=Halalkalibacter urbisdiaboli TaxID=1960589 RepID=UPI000B4528E9|nr:glycoside hydrolase family 65 [Halalkalibacter urbisdiaboli]
MSIDRRKLVHRHFPRLTEVDPLSPLSVGNGEFAFTVDVTGLQTFPKAYDVPLGTQSNWGWHSTKKRNLFDFNDITLQSLDTYGRAIDYPLHPKEKSEAYHWLRQNPHRLQLGQLSFRLRKENGQNAEIVDIQDIKQTLNLWEGYVSSHFSLEGKPVFVITACHSNKDEIGVKVVSPLIEQGRLHVQLSFPNPDIVSDEWDEATDLNWQFPFRHKTSTVRKSSNSITLRRTLDEDQYNVALTWDNGDIVETATHEYTLIPSSGEHLTFSISFAADEPIPSKYEDILQDSCTFWNTFWIDGAAIDFSESRDVRAHELERRVVLSQFLTAIHCSGSVPPQETGLMYNSWFGKFHLEMHWWHAAHFPIWNRTKLLQKSLDWYNSILPKAKDLAASQGYEGARWPKMVGHDGEQSPSTIAPVLIWQQPHPIMLAELCYTSEPNEEFLMKFKEMVFQSATFMASYAVWNQERKEYMLGPPLIPAQECHKPEESLNPPYELEYWKYGLEIASEWAKRLNEPIPQKWLEVAQGIAKPRHEQGVYLAHENCLDTFTLYNHDHPSMVGALGLLPGTLIDETIMRQTLRKVKAEWDWESAWGWDFPMCAMTAARLNEPELAVEFLLMDATKNTYLQNGHNYQRQGLTSYLPGNGGLLTAVAMMACGWQGKETDYSLFPTDGSWNVKWEGLKKIL